MPRHRGGNSRSRPNRDDFGIPDSPIPGQIGIPDFPIPGQIGNRGWNPGNFPDPNRESNPGKSHFFAAARTVIAHCQLQATGTASAIRLRRPWVGKEAHRPVTRSRQRLRAQVEAHTT
jgi:hypothetical protein